MMHIDSDRLDRLEKLVEQILYLEAIEHGSDSRFAKLWRELDHELELDPIRRNLEGA